MLVHDLQEPNQFPDPFRSKTIIGVSWVCSWILESAQLVFPPSNGRKFANMKPDLSQSLYFYRSGDYSSNRYPRGRNHCGPALCGYGTYDIDIAKTNSGVTVTTRNSSSLDNQAVPSLSGKLSIFTPGRKVERSENADILSWQPGTWSSQDRLRRQGTATSVCSTWLSIWRKSCESNEWMFLLTLKY